MKLTPHFTLEEFTASETATRLGIDNSLPDALRPAAVQTCELMERIRSALSRLGGRDIPIVVTSGYRSPALNTAIGSAPGSDHPRAMAVDFKAPAFGTPLQVASALAPLVSELDIGQLIYEHTWVHVSTRVPGNPVNRILTLKGKGYVAGIHA